MKLSDTEQEKKKNETRDLNLPRISEIFEPVEEPNTYFNLSKKLKRIFKHTIKLIKR